MVDLEVGAIRSATKFHLINADPNYQIILSRSWMHKYAVIPPSYHQCLKAVWAGKKVFIRSSENPFDTHEVHLLDAVYFLELGEVAQAITARPRGVKVPKWEDIRDEKQEARERDSSTAEAATPRKITKMKERGKTVYYL